MIHSIHGSTDLAKARACASMALRRCCSCKPSGWECKHWGDTEAPLHDCKTMWSIQRTSGKLFHASNCHGCSCALSAGLHAFTILHPCCVLPLSGFDRYKHHTIGTQVRHHTIATICTGAACGGLLQHRFTALLLCCVYVSPIFSVVGRQLLHLSTSQPPAFDSATAALSPTMQCNMHVTVRSARKLSVIKRRDHLSRYCGVR